MKINQSNYEIFFLDYLDGKLPDNQVDQFLDFLKKNPQLKEELKLIEGVKLEPEEIIYYHDKERLMKTSGNEENTFDYRAVAFIEGDLSKNDQELLLEEMEKDPAKEHDFDLLLSAKLSKEHVVFPNKKSLYRRDKKRLLYWTVRVAAILIVFAAIGGILTNERSLKEEEAPLISEVTPVQSTKSADDKTTKPKVVDDKKQDVTPKVEKAKKDSVSGKKKSIREKAKGRLKEVAMLDEAKRVSAPMSLQPIKANLASHSFAEIASLQKMNNTHIPEENYLRLDEYLAQKLIKLAKEDESSSFGKQALEKVSDYSNDKISYETNSKGKVSEIKLNTGLLAFSIPIKKNR